jgi:predicted ferric reductase
MKAPPTPGPARATPAPQPQAAAAQTGSRRAPERWPRWLGPAVLGAVGVGYVVLWIVARPSGQPTGRFIGELCGAVALLLLCCSLVLATLLAPIERAFGGLDRVADWHRRVAIAGMALLVPHLALVTSSPDPDETTLGHGLGDLALVGLLGLVLWALAPRLRAARRPGPIRALAHTSHEHWLSAHRLTGVFVAVAVAHAAIVDPVLRQSTVLRVAFIVVGAVGVGAYLYRELLARYVVPIHDYTVGATRRLNEHTIEIALDPARATLGFTPGQFVFVAFGGFDGWQRHPFSISSAASDRRLELTVKASGDYTDRLVDGLRPGVPARIAGPFGGFSYETGGREQIWIAGGIGVTPFISWLRSLDDDFDRDVDFYYSARTPADAVYREEIEAAAARHATLRVHLVYSDADGPLTVDDVMRPVAKGTTPSIYMCGPPAMMKTFARALRRRGIPPDKLRWEDFGER